MRFDGAAGSGFEGVEGRATGLREGTTDVGAGTGLRETLADSETGLRDDISAALSAYDFNGFAEPRTVFAVGLGGGAVFRAGFGGSATGFREGTTTRAVDVFREDAVDFSMLSFLGGAGGVSDVFFRDDVVDLVAEPLEDTVEEEALPLLLPVSARFRDCFGISGSQCISKEACGSGSGSGIELTELPGMLMNPATS